MSEPRDQRWENVWAIFRPAFDEASLTVYDNLLELHIEVVYDGFFFWSTQHFTKQELELQPSLFSWLMDKMVELIDNSMEEKGHGRVGPKG